MKNKTLSENLRRVAPTCMIPTMAKVDQLYLHMLFMFSRSQSKKIMFPKQIFNPEGSG